MKKLFALAAVLFATTGLLASDSDRTIPMPKRDQSVKIGFASDEAKIVSLRIQNYPDEDDVREAKTQDPDDKHITFWNFSVENRSTRKVRMKIAVEVIGEDGSVVGSGDKSDTVDAGKLDDNIRIWMRMRTLHIVNAKSAKLHLTIEPKS